MDSHARGGRRIAHGFLAGVARQVALRIEVQQGEDGLTTRTLSTFAGPKAYVRWSPDGRRLAFTGAPSTGASTTDVVYSLWVVRADGTGATTTPASGSVSIRDVAWSRDGARVAWIQAVGTRLQAVVSAAGGTSAPTALVQRAAGTIAYDLYVDWRPTAAP